MAGTFVAPDGITWIEYEAPSLVNAWAIAYSPSLNLFAAVSYNGYARVLTSSNGINWTLVIKGDAPGQYPKGWRDIVWGRNAFVAVGDKGILLSFDARNWTKLALPDLAYTSVTYSDELDRFVALSNSGIGVSFTITSNLNIEYSQSTIPVGRWSSVAYSDAIGRFVAISYAGSIGSIYSDDGLNWTNGSLQKNPWSKILWIPSFNRFFAVANTGERNVFTSTDGISWIEHDTTGGYWRDLAWSPGLNMFTIVSSAYDINNASSLDGGNTFIEYKNRRLASISRSDNLGIFVGQIVPDNLYEVETNYNLLVGNLLAPTPTVTPTISVTPTITPTPSITPTITPTPTTSHPAISYTLINSNTGATLPNNSVLQAQCIPIISTGVDGITCDGSTEECPISDCAPITGIPFSIRPSGGYGPYTVKISHVDKNTSECIRLSYNNQYTTLISSDTNLNVDVAGSSGNYGPISINGMCGTDSNAIQGNIYFTITDSMNYTYQVMLPYTSTRIYPTNPVYEQAPDIQLGNYPITTTYPRLQAIGSPYYLYVQPNLASAPGNSRYYMMRTFNIASAGLYTFKVYHDDNYKFYINGTLTVDDPTSVNVSNNENPSTYQINLEAGSQQWVMMYENIPNNTPGYIAFTIYDSSNNIIYISRADGWLALTTTTGV